MPIRVYILSMLLQGLLSTNFAQTLTLIVISARVVTKRKQTDKEGSGLGSNGKNSNLVSITGQPACSACVLNL